VLGGGEMKLMRDVREGETYIIVRIITSS
jgi:hypothetical protein